MVITKDQKNVEYNYVGKENFRELLKNIFPKELLPTNKTGYVLGFLFLLSTILAIFQFPFGNFLSGTVDIKIVAGYPFKFLEIDIANPAKIPFVIKGLIYDTLIYLLIGYIVDVAINLLQNANFIKSKKDLRIQPKIFNPKYEKKTLAEKTAEKILPNQKLKVSKETFNSTK